MKRREALVSEVSSSILMGSFPSDGLAVLKQGLLAGRVPGLSDPDEQGWFFNKLGLVNSCSVIAILNTKIS